MLRPTLLFDHVSLISTWMLFRKTYTVVPGIQPSYRVPNRYRLRRYYLQISPTTGIQHQGICERLTIMVPNIWQNPAVDTRLPANQPDYQSSVRLFHSQLPNYAATPLRSLPELAQALGLKAILLKDESDRLSLPSFKILGASWGSYRAITAKFSLPCTLAVAELKSYLEGKDLTLFAATDGNHGRAVAFMSQVLAIKAVILVPEALDLYTQNAIATAGGCVLPIAADYDGVVQEAQRRANATNGILVQDTSWPGYEKIPAWIVDGYSTIFSELEEQIGPLCDDDVVVVPIGVGSLAHSAVLNLKSRVDLPRIVAVEPENAPCLNTSLHAGMLQSVDTRFTIMTGMNCGTVSYTAWHDLNKGVDISLLVTDTQAHEAAEYLKGVQINAGPCGAATVAAARLLVENGLVSGHSRLILLNTEGWRPYETSAG